MKVILLLLLFIVASLSARTKRESAQPFFVPAGPGASTDITELFKYYGVFLVLPIVLGFLFSVALGGCNCMSCCCPSFLCKAPCCFNNRVALIIFFTAFFGAMIGCSVLAWNYAPQVSKGAGELFDLGSDAIDAVEVYFNDTKDEFASIKRLLSTSLTPLLNGTGLSLSNNETKDAVAQSYLIMGNITFNMAKIDAYYKGVGSGLDILVAAEPQYIDSGSTPKSSELPSPLSETTPSLVTINVSLDVVLNQSDTFDKQFLNAIPGINISNIIPDEFLSLFGNVTDLPFMSNGIGDLFSFLGGLNLPFGLGNLDFNNLSFDSILNATGLSDKVNDLRNTVQSALPFDIPNLSDFKKKVDENGGIYAAVVGACCGVCVLTYFAFYPGIIIKSKICLRFPLTVAGALMIPIGIGVGLHLGFGAVSDGFCVNNIEYLQKGATWLDEKAVEYNFSAAVRNVTSQILSDPERVFTCSGNQTFFSLYNIDPIEALGIEEKLLSLLPNLTDFLNTGNLNFTFPSSGDSSDPVMDVMYGNITMLINASKDWNDQRVNITDRLKDVQDQLNTRYLLAINQTDRDNITYLNDTLNNVTDALDKIRQEILDTQNRLDDLGKKADIMASSRRSFIDTLFNSTKFPLFNLDGIKGFVRKIATKLTECSWVGEFYERAIQEALCDNISPGVLWIGWGAAGLGLAMFASLPILMWSISFASNSII
eukprot:TRINITY_DN5131_c0_g1_i1.p1 TRINITY_DN5131_c0_g1~~TRINITY_DN5131_c0_g1_i1.p1  ORF type:complete len:709 (-),score=140.22 TRINITY_DN5131_c0_g1_i1:82-2208(-)